MKRLTDKQIQNILNKGIVKYSGLDIPKRRQAIDRDFCDAQLRQDRATIKTILDEIEQCAQGGVCKECLCNTDEHYDLECFCGSCVWWNRKKKEWLNNTI